jgi:hypothetical protein
MATMPAEPAVRCKTVTPAAMPAAVSVKAGAPKHFFCGSTDRGTRYSGSPPGRGRDARMSSTRAPHDHWPGQASPFGAPAAARSRARRQPPSGETKTPTPAVARETDRLLGFLVDLLETLQDLIALAAQLGCGLGGAGSPPIRTAG